MDILQHVSHRSVVVDDEESQPPLRSMHYVVTQPSASASRPTLFFVHGWPDMWFGWRMLLNHFRKSFNCIAIDLPGFGGSQFDISRNGTLSGEERLRPFTWKSVSRAFCCVLNAERVRQAVFIGHDWGGMAVWRMALWHPERVMAVAALCTPYTAPRQEYVPITTIAETLPAFYYQVYFNEEKGVVAAKELNADVTRTLSCILRSSDATDRVGKWMKKGDHSLLEHMDNNVKRSRMISQSELEYIVSHFTPFGGSGDSAAFPSSSSSVGFHTKGFLPTLSYYNTHRLNHQEELELLQLPRFQQGKRDSAHIECPALMVTAGKDFVLKPEMARGMEKYIPQLQRGHIEDAAHWVQLEQPKELIRILLRWFQTLQSAAL